MVFPIQHLIDEYWAWLKENTTLQYYDGWTEITTPHLDRNNDHLQIYAKKVGDNYRLTDFGYIMQELKMSGCDVSTPHRQELLKQALNGFGVRLEGDQLTLSTTEAEFPRNKHSLLQAMIAIDDLFYTSQGMVANLFLDDVEKWLREGRVRFLKRHRLRGRSRFEHVFDFAIPPSDTAPMRLVQTLSNPTHDKVKRIAFAWVDTEDYRDQEAQAFAIINDLDKPVEEDILEAFHNYGINPVPWTRRDEVRGLLAA